MHKSLFLLTAGLTGMLALLTGPQGLSGPAGAADQPGAGRLVITDSGLEYMDLAVGKGREAGPGDTATVEYTGWLENGTKFDSSRDHGKPFSFRIGAGQVIKGWDEGVTGMKVGGKRKLMVPPHLGYGARGAGGLIPPNAKLTFEVELLGLR
jgi:FKBP-type peptidyl-prolyl cis-trans isomerase FkpA